MKNFEIKKEIWIWVMMALPLLYLAHVWPTLPEMVPTHFGMDGQPNDWSHRSSLIFIIAGMLVGIYLMLTFIPAIDPKRKIESMGNKYFLFKLFLMVFITILSFFCIQMSASKNAGVPGMVNMVFVLVGGMFVFLGNYMQSIKPNYFIGIRTPWTLENETVWRKTHQLGGKLYFAAGLLVMILPFVLKKHYQYIYLAVIFSASIIPVVYSFIILKRQKASSKDIPE